METIQVILDSKLLQAATRAARRTKTNRSALIRDALREHLKRLHTLEQEQIDRKGYERKPAALFEWEQEAAWPED